MFTCRDVRKGMEVYDRAGRSLGVVLRVDCSPATVSSSRTTYPRSQLESSSPNGEAMGPGSTAALGNAGPATQSAVNAYAVHPAVGVGEPSPDRFLIGRWLGLRKRQWIDAGRIVNVSLERIILADEIS